MAGNKISAKTKGKEERGKANKGVTQSNDDSEDAVDFAVLRKPIPTSITGFAQARKIFDLATEELKDLLSNECDLMYECKVCRNIFRSLANFISHKRVYCKDKFNSTIHGHFVNSASSENEMLQIKRTEDNYLEALKIQSAINLEEKEDSDHRIPLTKDITAVYEKIIKAKATSSNDNTQVVLKKIPSSTVAVYQNIDIANKTSDSMRSEIQELDQLLSRKRAVLQSNGKFVIEDENIAELNKSDKSEKSNKPETSDKPDHDNVIQISDDEDNEDGDTPKCKICDLQFSTQKTLRFHMKYKHLESRLVYPCPDCLEIFSTSWSVYRHLFKVHRKTAAQIRRLRESIQSKAFKMNNPPAFYEKRKNMKPVAPQQITEEERRDQENQAWMDNMEGDGEVPRCGGCGRTFERRAALAAHTHTCQPRSRALARQPPRPDAKRIEIQIRKDYNKGPAPGVSLLKPIDAADKNTTEEPEPKSKPLEDDDKDEDVDEAPMDVDDEDQNSDASAESPEKNEIKLDDTIKPVIRLPYALQAEKSNLAAFKQRIASDIDLAKLICKKCDTKVTSGLELYEHMADHVKWMRYACKLCNFKHYSFDKLPEHVKVVHKLKGDSDFYYTTVKAIDGKEAMIISSCLSEPVLAEDVNDHNESPESRRPSRCSSDSSRLSDDSSSSSTLKETISRKRKIQQSKGSAKKKKDGNDDVEEQEDPKDKVIKTIFVDSNNSPSIKAFEENSSDFDDIEDKITKRLNIEDVTYTSRRPVRKRTKVKNADFEYDLSNLLKMEAQGYRDSQSTTTTKVTPQPIAMTKAPQPKKKGQSESTSNSNYESLNRDCCGALIAISKKAVEKAAAHMKTASFPLAVYSAKEQRANVFARPMVPRILSRGDKSSPKKDVSENNNSPNKMCKISETVSLRCVEKMPNDDQERESNNEKDTSNNFEKDTSDLPKSECDTKAQKDEEVSSIKNLENDADPLENEADPVGNEANPVENGNARVLTTEKPDASGQAARTIPTMVPFQLRRQSLELMRKHPIINKNIKDFSKAGMKTKILVIKPIHRNKDGKRPSNTPLKFQTIKLKETKCLPRDIKQSDQVMVVKVPKVPSSTISENTTITQLDSETVAIIKNVDCTETKFEETEVIDNVSENINDSEKKQEEAEQVNVREENCQANKSGIVHERVSDILVVEPAMSKTVAECASNLEISNIIEVASDSKDSNDIELANDTKKSHVEIAAT